MKISSLFRNYKSLDFLDIYSQEAQLKIQGKKSYSSLLSITLSILSLLTIITITTYFLISAFQRKILSVVYNVDSMVYPIVNLTEYPMTFQLHDGYGRVLPDQDRIFQMTAIYWEYRVILDQNNLTQIKSDYKVIELEKCEINKHFGQYKDFFLDVPDLSKKYCWPANSFNLTLYGKYGDVPRGFSVIQFFFQKCINGTHGKENCYDTKKIDDALSVVQFGFSQMDYDINHNNPNDPRVLTKRSDAFQLSSSVFRRITRNINHVKYSSDYGYLFEDIHELEFFQNDRDEILQDLRKEGFLKSSFSSFSINCSSKVQKYSRFFIKLQGMLANIGGIIKGITVSVKILHFFITRNLINFILFQSMLKNFENPSKKLLKNKLEDILNEAKDDTNKYDIDSSSIINLKHNVNVIKIPGPVSKIRMKNIQGQKFTQKDQLSKNLFYNMLDIILPNLLKKKKKSVLIYDKFKTWVNSNMSIENILEKLIEMDLLKKKYDELSESVKYKSESSILNCDRSGNKLENDRKIELNE